MSKKDARFRGHFLASFLARAFRQDPLSKVSIVPVAVTTTLDHFDLVVQPLHRAIGHLARAEVVRCCCMAILPQPPSGRTSPAGRGPTRHRLDETSYFSVDSAYGSKSMPCGRIAGAPSSSDDAVRCLSSLGWRYSRASTRTLCVKIVAATVLT